MNIHLGTHRVGTRRAPVFQHPVLLGLALPAALVAAGCADHSCDQDLCIDTDTIRASQIAIGLGPDTTSNEGALVSVGLPPPLTAGDCYKIPGDLAVRANGRSPETQEVVSHDGVPFSLSCTPDQEASFTFTVPTTPELLSITFARNNQTVTVDVTRPVVQPVDVSLSATAVDRQSTFSAELHPASGTLPAGECWSTQLSWNGITNLEDLATVAETIPSGVRLTLSFRADAPDPRTGSGTVTFSSAVGGGCEPAPTASCPGVASCSASRQLGHVLGPFPVTVR